MQPINVSLESAAKRKVFLTELHSKVYRGLEKVLKITNKQAKKDPLKVSSNLIVIQTLKKTHNTCFVNDDKYFPRKAYLYKS